MWLRLPKVERVHRPDRKYWKTDDGREAVRLAVTASFDKYDSAQLAPNSTPDLATTAAAVQAAMERIFVETIQDSNDGAAASEPELEAETSSDEGGDMATWLANYDELANDPEIWRAFRDDSNVDPGAILILEAMLDDAHIDPPTQTTGLPTGLPGLTIGLPSLPTDLPGSPNGLPGLPTGLPGSPTGLPSLPTGLPGSPAAGSAMIPLIMAPPAVVRRS